MLIVLLNMFNVLKITKACAHRKIYLCRLKYVWKLRIFEYICPKILCVKLKEPGRTITILSNTVQVKRTIECNFSGFVSIRWLDNGDPNRDYFQKSKKNSGYSSGETLKRIAHTVYGLPTKCNCFLERK